MRYEDLLEMIKMGEGYTMEFKERLSDSIAKDMCAFANSSGGKIIIGIDDTSNKVKGFRLTNGGRSRIQNYARNIDPSLSVTVEQLENLVVIYVPEGREKPYFTGGRCYLRQGANSQQLTRDEIRNFFQRGNLLKFDRKLNEHFDFKKDFNNKAFSEFIDLAGIDNKLSKKHILANLSLLEDDKLTNAGVLFFAKSIKKFFLNSVITGVLYQGCERIEPLDRQDFEYNFTENLRGIINFTMRNLKVKSVIKGLKRYGIPEIQKEILREIILNAMIHRDYWSEGRILVEIFKDRIEVSNPGGLMFDKKYLGMRSVTRNPILADLVYRMGFVDKIGSGINKIKRAFGEKVVFQDEKDWFRVIVKRETEEVSAESSEKSGKRTEKTDYERLRTITNDYERLSVEEQKVLLYLLDSKKISRKKATELLGLKNTKTYEILNALVSKGFLKRRGKGRGTYYTIKNIGDKR